MAFVHTCALTACADPGIFVKGGPGPMARKQPGQLFFFCILVLNLFYSLQEGSNGFITEKTICPLLKRLFLQKWWFCCYWFIVYCCSHCLWGFCVLSLFWYTVLSVLSSFSITTMGKRELETLYFNCLVIVSVVWLFLTVPRVGLQCVIVVFPDHTHLFFMFFYDIDNLTVKNWFLLLKTLQHTITKRKPTFTE